MQNRENSEERTEEGLGCGNEVEVTSGLPASVLLALLNGAAGLKRVVHDSLRDKNDLLWR